MPRQPRELVDGGLYHVFNRGNDRRLLFAHPDDYRYFLNHLGWQASEHALALYHYCLMPNHFHLLVRVQHAGDLPSLMHHVQLAYARYFKKSRDFVGHVFQERFRSPRIADESYYLQCGRYIERNPVKAGMVQTAAEYPFSSASFYALGRQDRLVTANLLYQQMGSTAEERQTRYAEFVALDEPYGDFVDRGLLKA